MALSFARVDARIRGEHGVAEFLEDFVVGGLAGLDELVGEGVGVEDGEAEFAEHGGDGRFFAAGDSTGEAESEHDDELYRARAVDLRRGKFRGGAAEGARL